MEALALVAKASSRHSLFKGVTLYKPTSKWRAQISHGGRTVTLGDYNREEEAARVFDRACICKYGRSAVCNFPIDDYEAEIDELHGLGIPALLTRLKEERQRKKFLLDEAALPTGTGANLPSAGARHHQQAAAGQLHQARQRCSPPPGRGQAQTQKPQKHPKRLRQEEQHRGPVPLPPQPLLPQVTSLDAAGPLLGGLGFGAGQGGYLPVTVAAGMADPGPAATAPGAGAKLEPEQLQPWVACGLRRLLEQASEHTPALQTPPPGVAGPNALLPPSSPGALYDISGGGGAAAAATIRVKRTSDDEPSAAATRAPISHSSVPEAEAGALQPPLLPTAQPAPAPLREPSGGEPLQLRIAPLRSLPAHAGALDESHPPCDLVLAGRGGGASNGMDGVELGGQVAAPGSRYLEPGNCVGQLIAPSTDSGLYLPSEPAPGADGITRKRLVCDEETTRAVLRVPHARASRQRSPRQERAAEVATHGRGPVLRREAPACAEETALAALQLLLQAGATCETRPEIPGQPRRSADCEPGRTPRDSESPQRLSDGSSVNHLNAPTDPGSPPTHAPPPQPRQPAEKPQSRPLALSPMSRADAVQARQSPIAGRLRAAMQLDDGGDCDSQLAPNCGAWPLAGASIDLAASGRVPARSSFNGAAVGKTTSDIHGPSAVTGVGRYRTRTPFEVHHEALHDAHRFGNGGSDDGGGVSAAVGWQFPANGGPDRSSSNQLPPGDRPAKRARLSPTIEAPLDASCTRDGPAATLPFHEGDEKACDGSDGGSNDSGGRDGVGEPAAMAASARLVVAALLGRLLRQEQQQPQQELEQSGLTLALLQSVLQQQLQQQQQQQQQEREEEEEKQRQMKLQQEQAQELRRLQLQREEQEAAALQRGAAEARERAALRALSAATAAAAPAQPPPPAWIARHAHPHEWGGLVALGGGAAAATEAAGVWPNGNVRGWPRATVPPAPQRPSADGDLEYGVAYASRVQAPALGAGSGRIRLMPLRLLPQTRDYDAAVGLVHGSRGSVGAGAADDYSLGRPPAAGARWPAAASAQLYDGRAQAARYPPMLQLQQAMQLPHRPWP